MSDEHWQRPPNYVPGAVPPPPVWAQAPTPNWWVIPPPTTTFGTPTAPSAQRPRSRRLALGIAAVTAGIAVAIGSTVIAATGSGTSGSEHLAFAPNSQGSPFSQYGSGSANGSGTSPLGGGSGTQTDPGQTTPYSSGGATTTTGQATAAQSVGVVDINTVLDYGSAQAAGTGIVLTSNGEILTNNHVVDGSTSISVTIVSTGKSYAAKVVGTDPTDDVAVLQLSGASGLATAKLGDSSKVAVDNTVTAVGNAGGTGGTPSSATGTVTGLNQSLTATDQDGSNSEDLTGMIEVNADIQAGDSGGPLYASNGTIIGIDTAASSTRSAQTTGYAIPIAKATAVADQIESGQASATIHVGYPAFLGVQLQSAGSFGSSVNGATIAGVVDDSGAAKAGLSAGDTITSLGGTTITSANTLSTAVANYRPGQTIGIGWVDSAGQSHSGSLTLGAGPAD